MCPDTQVTIEAACDGHHLRLRYDDVDIVVCSADGASLDWLEAFLLPSFETVGPAEIWRDDVPGSRRQVEHRVGYVVDRRRFAKLRHDIQERSTGSRPCFVLDSEVVRLPAVQHDERTWLLDEENGCVLIVGPGSIEIVANPAAPRQRLPLLRAVRDIAAEGWRRHGGHLQLHAAALAVGGEVVLFAGEKNAGKTTLLMHALSAPGARLVANDCVAVRLEKDHAVARGMPTIVSIRSGTLERFPKLLVGLPASPYPWSLTDAEWRRERNAVGPSPKRDHLRLSPPRFAAQLGCNVVAGGRVEAIFVCSLDPTRATRSVMPLRQSEARAALAACLYGRSASRVEPAIIAALVKGPAPADVATTLDALAARVKVFECRLGPDAYVEPFAFPSTAGRRMSEPNDESRLPVSRSTLAEHFGAAVVEVQALSASVAPGSESSVHRVALADGQVVKVRQPGDHVDAPMAGRILAALDDPGFARILALIDGVLIEEWIDGVPVPDPPDKAVLTQAGDLLGRVHARQRLDGLALHWMAPTARHLSRIEHDLEIVTRTGAVDAEIGRRLLASAVDCDPGKALVGVCHRDFCGANMIIDRHGQLRVIDNDTIVVAPLDLDLQRTAYRWQLSADQWAVFLRAYCMHRRPQLTEQSARFWRLRAVALSAAFRVRRGLTSVTAPLAELTKLAGDS